MKLVTVAQMQEIERQADAGGLSYAEMMENAGKGLAQQIHKLYPPSSGPALALVGSGNNGGDALVALTYLSSWGWTVSVCLVGSREEGDPLVKRVVEGGGELISYVNNEDSQPLSDAVQNAGVILDGVLGTGIRLPLKPRLAEFLTLVQQSRMQKDPPALVVAVDCPSGVDCNTGETAPETLPADVTVTMAAVKMGLLKLPAFEKVGQLHLVPIGDLKGFSVWDSITRVVVDAGWTRANLPRRSLEAHKGTFGTALVVAGSLNYTGAVYLAGQAAYRVGTGLVTLGVPGSLHTTLAGQFPEATWLLLPEEQGVVSADAAAVVLHNLTRVTALLIGPGFGLEKTTQQFIERILAASSGHQASSIGFLSGREGEGEEPASLPPMVIDADGLKLLARVPDWQARLPANTILTPHPGEMAILTGLSTAAIQEDRLSLAEKYAREWNQIVILKGAFTVIAAPSGKSAVVPVASPALARAGTGDVLAGMAAGFLAQGMDPFEAAAAAAWLHAQAGLIAAESLRGTTSVVAGDVLRSVPEAIARLGNPG